MQFLNIFALIQYLIMLRKLSFLVYLAMLISFALTFLGRVYLAGTILKSATIAYAVLTPLSLYKARFRFRMPFLSEIIMGGLVLFLLYGAYGYVRVVVNYYYLFCICFVIRTLAKNDVLLAER
jgi:hypothetical protein